MGSGTPMSRGWVPYGKHAIRSTLGPRYCEGRGQGPSYPTMGWMPLPVGARLGVPRGQGDKDEPSGFASLAASIPTWTQQLVIKKARDVRIHIWVQIDSRKRVVKVLNSHPVAIATGKES